MWAWERTERLRFLNVEQVAVAFLAGTLGLREDGEIQVRPRRSPLEIPPGIRLTAVIRIEADRMSTPSFETISRMVTAIRRLTDWLGVAAVQIDFDATRSQVTRNN
ncbi:hypothetical protein CCP4SC76_7940004 [Gammaproteobacteria bacterium]